MGKLRGRQDLLTSLPVTTSPKDTSDARY